MTNIPKTVRFRPLKTQDTTFTIDTDYKRLLEELFPNASWQIRNHVYLAICTKTPEGVTYDVYVRRAIADLRLRDEGRLIPKGYSVETVSDDPTDLRWGNLKIVFNAQLPEEEQRRKTGFQTHRIIGIRLKALFEGRCPDEAMAEVIASFLVRSAANDNQPECDAGVGT
tara:strand:+ start:150 stop:656 length:507 start_codon:yes stop_codon:yes gene_type:complete